jgi:hypothetical protein
MYSQSFQVADLHVSAGSNPQQPVYKGIDLYSTTQRLLMR